MDDLRFMALVVRESESGQVSRAVEQKSIRELPPGEVLIRVRYSSLNYKDALSANGNRGVTKHYPHTPGIDAAGVVVASTVATWRSGDEVICTGHDLGMNTTGGFGQYIRAPASWLVARPEGLSLLEAMQLGTAGFTAGLCLLALRDHDRMPEKGPIMVSGASGGVGGIALQLLHHLGYESVAVSGKPEAASYLRSLGASQVISRQDALGEPTRQLFSPRWSGAIDTVGGELLASTIKSTDFDGVVTCCGNAASADLPLNVYPFILRGVHLIGIYSAQSPMPRRLRVWNKLAGEWKFPELGRMCRLISLHQLSEAIEAMLAGRNIGRVVIDLEAGQ